MTYDQALAVVKSAMKGGAPVSVTYAEGEEQYVVVLTTPSTKVVTAEFALAVAHLPEVRG